MNDNGYWCKLGGCLERHPHLEKNLHKFKTLLGKGLMATMKVCDGYGRS